MIDFNNAPQQQPDDDRMDRWMYVNGVVHVGWELRADGSAGRMIYSRADGSMVDPANSYPYDAMLTPYTKVEGHA